MKQKTKKLLFLGLLMATVALLLIGCGTPSEAKRERKLKKLLSDKYGEEFVIRESFVNSGVHAWCYPESDPSLIFEIETPTKMDKIIADNYLQNIVERQLDEELQTIVDDLINDSYISSNFILGATTDYQNPKANDVDLNELLDYIHSEGKGDDVIFTLFVNELNDDIENEYLFIISLGEMYQKGDFPGTILTMYFGNDEFIEESKKLIDKYGWTIAMGSDSRFDINDVVRDRNRIVVHYYEDGKPYIINSEDGKFIDLDYEKYQELRMGVLE